MQSLEYMIRTAPRIVVHDETSDPSLALERLRWVSSWQRLLWVLREFEAQGRRLAAGAGR